MEQLTHRLLPEQTVPTSFEVLIEVKNTLSCANYILEVATNNNERNIWRGIS